MIKHVGRHNNQKVVLVFRKLPDPQSHMALVVYSNALPQNYHDSFMKVLESPQGQQAKDFADALHRNLFPDGRNMLNILHHNGWLKKVPAQQIIVEANAKSHVRLDELNKIIDEMESGAEAEQRLRELDERSGLQIKESVERTSAADMAASAETVNQVSSDPIPAPINGVLTDEDIARNNLQQAEQMEAQIKVLEAEAKSLREEAYEMAPSLKPKRTRKTAAKKKVA